MDLTDLMRDDTQQTLTLTVMDGPSQVKTRQDVSNMSLDEFAMLTAVSFQTLGLSTQVFSQGSPFPPPPPNDIFQCVLPLGVS